MNEGFMDVAAIEKELKELWTDMSSEKGQKEAVTRTCVHNLIVYAPGEQSDAEVNAIVAEVTVQNPGRVFILLPEPSSKEKKVSAWVSSQCYRTSGMRQQICCEQIMVRAQGDAVQDLASIIDPLTIPDLPVFVWWRAPLSKGKVFEDLMEFANRTIVDSSIQSAGQSIQEINQLLVRNISACAFSDLNWARLTIWREMIARFFDSSDALPQLNEISRIEISSDQPLPLQPLFLISWLGSRLKWRIESKIKNEANHISLRCVNAHNRTVDVLISKGNTHLDSIRLLTETNIFSVSFTGEAFHVEVASPKTGKVTFSQDKKFVPLKEADLLRKELQIICRDQGYEETIQFLNTLL
jgi:glucose-6-phosphate dehydrogenase assembly protein OpcA